MSEERDFFKSSLCRVCKKLPEKPAKFCSKCKVVSYCSKDHQQQDWQNHKALCRVIASEPEYLEYNVTSYEELHEFKQQRGLYWQLKLGRRLTMAEAQMFMFPRVCAVCFQRESLIDCGECWSEFYCSLEHLNQHKHIHEKFCKDLRLSLDTYLYLFNNDVDTSAIKVKMPESKIIALEDHVEFLNHFLDFTRDINDLLCCDQVLGGLTILFGLEQSGILKSRNLAKTSLDIHIVGASVFEYNLQWAIIIEIFFHWIRNLQEVHISLIGPEAIDFPDNFADKKNIKLNIYKNLYHEIAAQLQKPDIVVAFNSGLHEFHESDNDSWRESLQTLFSHPNVPFLMTGYTWDEIQNDQ